MTYILLFAACWLIGLPVLRYLLFWGIHIHAGKVGLLRASLGGGPLTSTLFAFATAVLAELGIVCLHAIAWAVPSQRMAEGTPLILVHGLYHNPAVWLWFRILLARAGHRNIYVYGYNSLTQGFDTAVAGLAKFVTQVHGENPEKKVVLLGHSLGGLVCRKVAAQESLDGTIAAVITLASPHGGSALARLAFGPAARGLHLGGSIATALQECCEADIPKLSLFSSMDDYVLPVDALQVTCSGWQEERCAPISHVWFLFSQDVSWRVARFLDHVLGQESSSQD